MPADPKLLPIVLGAGMDQSIDEYAAPPGNIRYAINTRVRKGGSLEQRHGVHGFALSVPSLMMSHGLQPTGVLEFAAQVAGVSVFGTDGKAVFSKRGDGNFCGPYGRYLPIRRTNAFLDEGRGGFGYGGVRPCASVVATGGEEYIAIGAVATGGFVDPLTIVETADGVRQLANRPEFGANDMQLVGSRASRRIYRALTRDLNPTTLIIDHVDPALPSGMSQTTSITIPSGAPWAVCESRSGASHICVAWQSSPTGITVQHRRQLPSAQDASVVVPIAPVAIGKAKMTVLSTPEYTALGILRDPVATGSPEFAVMSASLGTLISQGQLYEPRANCYSTPLLGITEDPSRFVWALGRALDPVDTDVPAATVFGKIRANGTGIDAAIVRNVLPISEFDEWGALWALGAGEPGRSTTVPTMPVFGRIGLISTPHELTELANRDENKRRTRLHLSARRMGPNPVRNQTWFVGTNRYSSVGKLPARQSVVLPVMLRSQDVGLFALERYDYQHNSQFQSRGTVGLSRGLAVAGQPYTLYPSSFVPELFDETPQNCGSEMGFFEEPQIMRIFGSPGGAVNPGSHLYCVVFEWISPSGERHRSRPSPPVAITLTTAATVTVMMTHAGVTTRMSALTGQTVAHVYRTVADQKQFLRVTPDTGAPAADRFGSLDFEVQFDDTLADDAIRAREVLYTDGGVQPNDLAPSCRFMALGQDRLWLGGLFERDVIQSSKVFVPNEPIQFSELDSFKVRLPFDNTGLAYLDGALVVFCENSIYLVSGDGPNNQGAGGYTIRPIAENVGCDDDRSIVVTSIGVFFKSTRGIQLMPRGFSSPELFRQLNETMGDFGDGFSEVIGASSHESSDEETVRFLLRNPSTNQRIVATVELSTKTWSYDVVRDQSGNPQPICCIGDGPEGPVYGAGSGTYRAMTEFVGLAGTTYDSMGSTVNRFLSEVRLAKMQPFGPAGNGRINAVHLRGYSPATGAQVNLSFVTDYGVQTHMFSGIGSGTFFRRAVPGNAQASTECQISATFVAGEGRLPGLRLLTLTLEIEPGSGARRPREGEQV